MKFYLSIFSIIYALVGFAQSNNEVLAAELSTYIENQMVSQNIPGLSACIVKEGQVVWQDAYGLAHIADGIPVTTQTEFTLASISKLFTATACALLVEDGLLDMDADINTYLPIAVINPTHPTVAITTRMLLNHKSSLRDSESDLQLWDEIGDPSIALLVPATYELILVDRGGKIIATETVIVTR